MHIAAPLPARLRSEPLIDAIFEMRFTAESAAQILPGMLYSGLSGEKRLENLPASGIPEDIRRKDPNLAAQPVSRILWDRYILSFGDVSFGIGCRLPYPGWAAFRQQILTLAGRVIESGLINKVERYDLRYVDLIDGQGPEDLAPKLDASLTLGGVNLADGLFHLQAMVECGGMPHHVRIALPAEMQVGEAAAPRRGLLLETNTTTQTDCAADAFMGLLQDRLDAVHDANKAMFFACLTDEAVEAMGPEKC
jgi:uncharacterized protein (TIGR04255 family)